MYDLKVSFSFSIGKCGYLEEKGKGCGSIADSNKSQKSAVSLEYCCHFDYPND